MSGSVSGVLNPGNYFLLADALESLPSYDSFTNSFALLSTCTMLFSVSLVPIVNTSISGNVQAMCADQPITNASVQIGMFTTSTDISGHYAMSNLPPATYTIIAAAPGYASITNIAATSTSSTSVVDNIALPNLLSLDFFGVGVNWANVTTPASMNGVRGDLDAQNLYNHLKGDLVSSFKQGSVVLLNATQSSANNLNLITTQFQNFANNVCPSDTVVIYASSHGDNYTLTGGGGGSQVIVSEDTATYSGMTSQYIKGLINLLPVQANVIVILDTCHSGGIAQYLVNSYNDISVLAATSVDQENICGQVYNGTTMSESDGTGVFTDSLISEIDRKVFDLDHIASDLSADYSGLYAFLLGDNLNLRDSGTSIFSGLQPQLWRTSQSVGTLSNSVTGGLGWTPKLARMNFISNMFNMTLTNISTNGFVAIEMSTNLTSWLQVACNPANGTNLNYSFPTTNVPCQFFRTEVVP
jgi:hypothetical protein